MGIGVGTEKPMRNISITSSYAPQNGYSNERLGQYWGEINKHLESIPGKLIKCRRADNNGQICTDNSENKNIGNCTIPDKLIGRMGSNLIKRNRFYLSVRNALRTQTEQL